MKSRSTSANYWPLSITLAFAIFILALAAWIAFAVREPLELVRADYYEHQLGYQNRLDSVYRAIPFQGRISVEYNVKQGALILTLPSEHSDGLISGRVQLYRPSAAKLDQEHPFFCSPGGLLPISVGLLRPGLWRVRLEWEVAGDRYYAERKLVIGRSDNS